MFTIFDLQDQVESAKYENFLARIHPDDVEMVQSRVADGAVNGRYEAQYRVVHRDGKIIHVQASGESYEHTDGGTYLVSSRNSSNSTQLIAVLSRLCQGA